MGTMFSFRIFSPLETSQGKAFSFLFSCSQFSPPSFIKVKSIIVRQKKKGGEGRNVTHKEKQN
jgi:hypothetical protein